MNDIWPTITSDTPMEELQAIHKRIWDYVIEHGKKPNTPYFANCVACEYARVISWHELGSPICSNCPLRWSDGKECGDHSSLYDAFNFYRKRILDYMIEHAKKPDTPYFANCVGCEYARIVSECEAGSLICPNCPIHWPDGKHCGDQNSLYDAYRLCQRMEIISFWKDFAKQIRDVEFERKPLPTVEGVREKDE